MIKEIVDKAKKMCLDFGGEPIRKEYVTVCDFGPFKIEFPDWFVDHASKVVLMRPEEFLSKVPPSPFSRDIIEEKKAGIRGLIKSGRPLEPLFLSINEKTGKVVGHEGRHRMMVLKGLGAEKVPVFIFLK